MAKEEGQATCASGRLAQRLEPAAHNGLTLVRLQHRLPTKKAAVPDPLGSRTAAQVSQQAKGHDSLRSGAGGQSPKGD